MTNVMSIYNCLLLSVAVLILLIVNILNERKTKCDVSLLQVLLLTEFTWLKTSVLKNLKSSVLWVLCRLAFPEWLTNSR